MFGSQALETVIGLAFMLFILATAASAIAELIAQIFRKRAKDLEAKIKQMLTASDGTSGTDPSLERLEQTSVWKAHQSASLFGRKVQPSYMAAKAFADAITEMLEENDTNALLTQFPGLRRRLRRLKAETDESLLQVKAGLESWFDDAMARLEGEYRRWVNLVLFVIGLALTVALDASVIHVARDLWMDPATREAVVQAASQVNPEGVEIGSLQDVGEAVEEITALGIPLGWAAGEWQTWATWDWALRVGGWLLTAVLIMLGGPFWFDLMSRLVAVRGAGKKPDPAPEDDRSATNRALTAFNARPTTTVAAGQATADSILQAAAAP